MRLPPTRARHPQEPIGPLVDVVFLLLVFFLLAGTLEPTRPIEVDAPESEHADQPESHQLRVLLDAQGRIGFEGQVLDSAALAEAIAPRMGADSRLAVQVEADRNTPSGLVLALLKQLRELGVEAPEILTHSRRIAPSGHD